MTNHPFGRPSRFLPLRREVRFFLYRFGVSTSGATAIEYGLIAAGIALTIAASVFLFGDAVYSLLYEDLPGALEG